MDFFAKFTRVLVAIDTLILPKRIFIGSSGKNISVSAISGHGKQLSPYFGFDWENPGTDQMRSKRINKQFGETQNIPHLNHEKINPLLYENDFTDGFKKTYQTVLDYKALLIGPKSPLNSFQNAEIRLVLRNTGDYGKLLIESFHPRLWYYPKEREQHFNWLRNSKIYSE